MRMRSIWQSDQLEAVSYISEGRGLMEEDVVVDFSPERFRMLETEETRKMIERRWEEARAENSRLYNATKYRLAGQRMEADKLVLQLDCDVSQDHVGTNLSPSAHLYLQGKGEGRYSHMSQCVGVGAWLLTADNRIVLVENAAWKGEQACRIDRPGGHAEPQETLKVAGLENIREASGEMVRRELFDCIAREVRDELNIPRETQQPPELLGTVINHERAGRLSLDFLIRCSLSSQEILCRYREGGAETDESTQLFFIKLDTVRQEGLETEMMERFSPHCAASWNLIRLRLEGKL